MDRFLQELRDRNLYTMKKTTLTLLFFLLQIFTFGQEKLMKDLDNDGVKDSIYIDSVKSTIVCKLSTQNFKAISSKPLEDLNNFSGVVLTKNGFEFFYDWMRACNKNQFRYNPKTKKVQLIGMSRYEFGNHGDGAGESSVNLLTNNYIGKWTYFDHLANNEEGKLVKIPTIKTKMKFKETNLEDFGEDTYFEFSEKCSKLYYERKEKMMGK